MLFFLVKRTLRNEKSRDTENTIWRLYIFMFFPHINIFLVLIIYKMLYYMKLILNILESGVKHHNPTTVNFVGQNT